LRFLDRRDFRSVEAMAREGDKKSQWKTDYRASREDGRDDWAGSTTWAQALERALYGWKEGREKLSSGVVAAVKANTPSMTPLYHFDVGGLMPDMDRYLAGDPACMVTYASSEKRSKPIIRILVDGSYSCGVSQQVVVNAGAALLSYVDRFTVEGYSVELRVAIRSEGGDVGIDYRIMVKDADQPLDLNRTAFALISPSMYRRVSFAVTEQCPEIEDNFRHGYGYPTAIPESDVEAGVIYIPSPNNLTETCSTTEGAVKEIGRILQEGGAPVETSYDWAGEGEWDGNQS
jgi:hypothetical protein|tara:strand:+ start:528 stop:1394 length:867 start_codon:yes stop_codon:yes gene_type:complete